MGYVFLSCAKKYKYHGFLLLSRLLGKQLYIDFKGTTSQVPDARFVLFYLYAKSQCRDAINIDRVIFTRDE